MSTDQRSGLLRGASLIAVAIMVMNIAAYGFTMVAARLLGPREYGGFAGLMALVLVFNVLPLALQATAARRISADPRHAAQIERTILRVTYRAALLMGAVLILATPLIDRILRLDNWVATALLGVTLVPLTVMGGQAGVLQGARQWGPLAAVYLAFGLPRLVVGSALVWWQPSATTAMVAVAVSAFAPAIVGHLALRRRLPAALHADRRSEDHRFYPMLRESLHNSQALLAFFALSNVDLIVARNVMSEHQAGLYAGGVILTKAVLFLPQFVVVVAFPSMSTPGERRRGLTRSLGVVALLGVVACLAAALLASVALIFIGGDEYAEIRSLLWLFAVLGTVLSMVQVLVYSVLARQGQKTILLVWAGLLLTVLIGMTADSAEGLLRIVIATNGLLFVLLLAISMYVLRRPLPDPVEEPAPAE